MKVSSWFKPFWFPTSPGALPPSLLLSKVTEKKKVKKFVRFSARSVFPSAPRQLPALPDRQHAAGRHRDHRRRPAAAVSRRPLRPLVLQLPRRPGLRRRPPNVLDPRGPGSERVVSVLLPLFVAELRELLMNGPAADLGYCVFVYKSTNLLLMRPNNFQ